MRLDDAERKTIALIKETQARHREELAPLFDLLSRVRRAQTVVYIDEDGREFLPFLPTP